MIYPPITFNPTELNEKYSLKRAANCIGGAYTFMLVFSFVAQIILMLVLRLNGFSVAGMNDLLTDGYFSCLLQIVLSTAMFTVPYILAARAARTRATIIIDFGKPKKGLFVPFLLLGLGVCMLGEVAANMFSGVMSSVGIEPSMPESAYGKDLGGVIIAFITVAVTPALVEEFAMRGVVAGILKPFGEGFAIVISAAVFGFMHRNLIQIPFAFAVGIGLAFIAIKSGSIWTSVTVHFINNLISLLMYYASFAISEKMQSLVYVSYGVIMLAAGIVGAVLLSRKDDSVFTLDGGKTTATAGKKTGWFFSAPFMIVALVLTFIDIIVIQVMY